VPKVTTPAANKPVEAKKVEATPAVAKKLEAAPANATKVEAKKTEAKAPMPVNQTTAPVVVKKAEVNKTIATPVKEAAKEAAAKPEFAKKNATAATPEPKKLSVTMKPNATNATAPAVKK
jgi:hypothetical protein